MKVALDQVESPLAGQSWHRSPRCFTQPCTRAKRGQTRGAMRRWAEHQPLEPGAGRRAEACLCWRPAFCWARVLRDIHAGGALSESEDRGPQGSLHQGTCSPDVWLTKGGIGFDQPRDQLVPEISGGGSDHCSWEEPQCPVGGRTAVFAPFLWVVLVAS